MKLARFFILVLGLLPAVLFAQDEATPFDEERKPLKKEYYFFRSKASVTVPNPIANKAFRKSFVGIYEINGTMNVMLYKNLFAGVAYKNGVLKVMENKIPDYDAEMHINNVSAKVGVDFYVGEKNRMIFSAAVAAGKNWTYFTGLICKNAAPTHTNTISHYESTFIEPEINLIFLTEQNFGIGAILSYTTFNRVFNPFELCLDDWAQFDVQDPGATQYLSFGFSFYYSFLRKK